MNCMMRERVRGDRERQMVGGRESVRERGGRVGGRERERESTPHNDDS